MSLGSGCRACGGRVTPNTRECFHCGQITPHSGTARVLRWMTWGWLTFLVLLVLLHTAGVLAQTADQWKGWREFDVQEQCRLYSQHFPEGYEARRRKNECIITQVEKRDEAQAAWIKATPEARAACAASAQSYPDVLSCLSQR